ncbi:Acetyltransferase (GNAT) domain [Salix suchowensis]|nr:Acetyltransferase (GNAT) domain [Salix suchowensis]
MCGSWLLGDYPIFIWAPPKAERRSDATSSLVEFLRKRVPDKRVFSVFGPTDITQVFSSEWSKVTGVPILREPYYDAYLARCTKNTLRQGTSTMPLPQGHKTRVATTGDLNDVAELCKQFADDESAPYNFSAEDSRLEAQELIRAQQVWVYEASSGVIACICAAARHSQRASVISKVYTSKAFRRKGFAERLVRHVVQQESVVLYVGKNNPARRVYDRVGFSGIGDQAKSSDDHEDWLEVGFDVAITGVGDVSKGINEGALV